MLLENMSLFLFSHGLKQPQYYRARQSCFIAYFLYACLMKLCFAQQPIRIPSLNDPVFSSISLLHQTDLNVSQILQSKLIQNSTKQLFAILALSDDFFSILISNSFELQIEGDQIQNKFTFEKFYNISAKSQYCMDFFFNNPSLVLFCVNQSKIEYFICDEYCIQHQIDREYQFLIETLSVEYLNINQTLVLILNQRFIEAFSFSNDGKIIEILENTFIHEQLAQIERDASILELLVRQQNLYVKTNKDLLKIRLSQSVLVQPIVVGQTRFVDLNEYEISLTLNMSTLQYKYSSSILPNITYHQSHYMIMADYELLIINSTQVWHNGYTYAISSTKFLNFVFPDLLYSEEKTSIAFYNVAVSRDLLKISNNVQEFIQQTYFPPLNLDVTQRGYQEFVVSSKAFLFSSQIKPFQFDFPHNLSLGNVSYTKKICAETDGIVFLKSFDENIWLIQQDLGNNSLFVSYIDCEGKVHINRSSDQLISESTSLLLNGSFYFIQNDGFSICQFPEYLFARFESQIARLEANPLMQMVATLSNSEKIILEPCSMKLLETKVNWIKKYFSGSEYYLKIFLNAIYKIDGLGNFSGTVELILVLRLKADIKVYKLFDRSLLFIDDRHQLNFYLICGSAFVKVFERDLLKLNNNSFVPSDFHFLDKFMVIILGKNKVAENLAVIYQLYTNEANAVSTIFFSNTTLEVFFNNGLKLQQKLNLTATLITNLEEIKIKLDNASESANFDRNAILNITNEISGLTFSLELRIHFRLIDLARKTHGNIKIRKTELSRSILNLDPFQWVSGTINSITSRSLVYTPITLKQTYRSPLDTSFILHSLKVSNNSLVYMLSQNGLNWWPLADYGQRRQVVTPFQLKRSPNTILEMATIKGMNYVFIVNQYFSKNTIEIYLSIYDVHEDLLLPLRVIDSRLYNVGYRMLFHNDYILAYNQQSVQIIRFSIDDERVEYFLDLTNKLFDSNSTLTKCSATGQHFLCLRTSNLVIEFQVVELAENGPTHLIQFVMDFTPYFQMQLLSPLHSANIEVLSFSQQSGLAKVEILIISSRQSKVFQLQHLQEGSQFLVSIMREDEFLFDKDETIIKTLVVDDNHFYFYAKAYNYYFLSYYKRQAQQKQIVYQMQRMILEPCLYRNVEFASGTIIVLCVDAVLLDNISIKMISTSKDYQLMVEKEDIVVELLLNGTKQALMLTIELIDEEAMAKTTSQLLLVALTMLLLIFYGKTVRYKYNSIRYQASQ